MKKLCIILHMALILCFVICCQDKETTADLDEMKVQAEVEEQTYAYTEKIIQAWVEKQKFKRTLIRMK